jgi:hypothetical protein
MDPIEHRTDVPPAWDERSLLTTMLDYARATVHAKCAGVAEQDARAAPLPGSPLMTLSGLVSHLRWVEYFWIQVTLLGEEDHGPWTDDDPDREMRIAVDVPIAQLLADYLLHLIEETARHNGHIDILRELADGVTGT